MNLRPMRHGWLLVFFVILIGCGGKDGPQRYQRQGKITFNGQPVGKGEIIVSPDRSKGMKGPGTTVTFEDGEYCTRDGMGSWSGPHVLIISGYDGNQGKPNAAREPHPWGGTLFTGHRIEVDFPAENSTHDFDITK